MPRTGLPVGRSEVARITLRAVGNVFLGVAIGLIGYYFVTDLFTVTRQKALAAELPDAIRVQDPRPASSEEGLDFSGWARQDRVYWMRLKEGRPFGRLVAPAMGLDEVVVKGTSRSDLMKGPGWITWSDLPGPTGNCGISGHRTTYGAPFRHLDRLKPGDTVKFYSPFRVYTYRVKRVFAVRPTRVDVVETTRAPTLTMTACHPPYSARLRLIAQSELVSAQPLER